jgi:hypothetical protein
LIVAVGLSALIRPELAVAIPKELPAATLRVNVAAA